MFVIIIIVISVVSISVVIIIIIIIIMSGQVQVKFDMVVVQPISFGDTPITQVITIVIIIKNHIGIVIIRLALFRRNWILWEFYPNLGWRGSSHSHNPPFEEIPIKPVFFLVFFYFTTIMVSV